MIAPDDRLLQTYLEARYQVSCHLDDPSPVLTAWTAQRAVELMLVKRGWTEGDLDDAYERYERDQLLALDVEGWRSHLVAALAQSTDRSVRVAQAMTRYRERASGPAD